MHLPQVSMSDQAIDTSSIVR